MSHSKNGEKGRPSRTMLMAKNLASTLRQSRACIQPSTSDVVSGSPKLLQALSNVIVESPACRTQSVGQSEEQTLRDSM